MTEALGGVRASGCGNCSGEAGVSVRYREFPTVGRATHGLEPNDEVATLVEWLVSLA